MNHTEFKNQQRIQQQLRVVRNVYRNTKKVEVVNKIIDLLKSLSNNEISIPNNSIQYNVDMDMIEFKVVNFEFSLYIDFLLRHTEMIVWDEDINGLTIVYIENVWESLYPSN